MLLIYRLVVRLVYQSIAIAANISFTIRRDQSEQCKKIIDEKKDRRDYYDERGKWARE